MLKNIIGFCFLIKIMLVNSDYYNQDETSKPKIFGGNETTPSAYPFQISLQSLIDTNKSSHICGGVILTEYFILTAAHCRKSGNGEKSRFKVIAGAFALKNQSEPSRQEKEIAEYYIHRDPLKDISLIKLKTPLSFYETVQPIKLPQKGYEPKDDTQCVTIGWGMTDKPPTDTLREVKIPIVNRNKCRRNYEALKIIQDWHICAGDLNKGGCMGDSGGPLLCPNETGEMILVGIVHGGYILCGLEIYPTYFTSVGYFIDWIKNLM